MTQIWTAPDFFGTSTIPAAKLQLFTCFEKAVQCHIVLLCWFAFHLSSLITSCSFSYEILSDCEKVIKLCLMGSCSAAMSEHICLFPQAVQQCADLSLIILSSEFTGAPELFKLTRLDQLSGLLKLAQAVGNRCWPSLWHRQASSVVKGLINKLMSVLTFSAVCSWESSEASSRESSEDYHVYFVCI